MEYLSYYKNAMCYIKNENYITKNNLTQPKCLGNNPLKRYTHHQTQPLVAGSVSRTQPTKNQNRWCVVETNMYVPNVFALSY